MPSTFIATIHIFHFVNDHTSYSKELHVLIGSLANTVEGILFLQPRTHIWSCMGYVHTLHQEEDQRQVKIS